MNGRFPFDVLMIIIVPFVVIAAAIPVTFYVPHGVHDHLAVLLTLVLAVGLTFGL